MMRDFVGQLRQLQLDRIKYEKQKDKTKYSHKMNKQENKYQAYILNQMADKNRFIASAKIIQILHNSQKSYFTQFFKKISKKPVRLIENQIQVSHHEIFHEQYIDSVGKQETVTVDFILVKLCSDVIKRQMQKAINVKMRSYFENIRQFSRKKKILSHLSKNLTLYFKRHGFKSIKDIINRQRMPLSEGKMFDEDFSMIEKYQKPKKDKIHDQSYLSFIFDKENIGLECLKCRQNTPILSFKDKQIASLKEQLGFLKGLVVQKNLQLKKRDEQIYKMNQISRKDLDEPSQMISRNSISISEMERCVFGGKRIRKNTNGSIVSNQSKQEISKQLLGKYMKQSFQLKENIDIARQLCLDLEGQLPLTYRIKLQSLIKVLSLNDDISFADQTP